MMMRATRDAYGEALVEIGRKNPEVVVLDADLSASTKTEKFKAVFPERFFNMGIAEANMMGVAAGLARSGKIPFVSTFAVFATGRAYDQIRQSIAYPRFNVKIVASHGGLSVGPDGASHQALEDIALMRVVPGMTVIVPSDAEETKQAIEEAVKHDGPFYIRLGREKVPHVFPQNLRFEVGKGLILWPQQGRVDVLRERRFNISFIACGIMVAPALKAASHLEEMGISCLVADFSCIKPLDGELLYTIAEKSDAIVTCEEHSVIGGLGGAVSEFLAEEKPTPVFKVGVKDQFGQSGDAQELLSLYGLDENGLIDAAKKAMSRVQGRL